MPDLLYLPESSTLLQPVEVLVLLTDATQGPPGPPGNAGGALLVTNRLSELSTDPAAQEAAQTNLGLGLADPLAYYILAKA